MEQARSPELWRDLYVMLGTSSAGLLGLLFVATSLHIDDIVSNPVYRTRARNNSIYLILTLIEAAMVLTPQPLAALGAELIALNLFGLWLPVRNVYRFPRKDRVVTRSGGWTYYRVVAFIAAFLLGLAGGAWLLAGVSAGLYLLTISYLTFLVTVALNGWSIMLGIGQAETMMKSKRATRGNAHRAKE
jgi:hypothetical protein